jgi:hypothetical protein
MAEESGLRRLPVRVIRWLGHDILEQHPLVRMLHENRAQAAAQEKKLPLTERRSYQIRQQRIFARGRIASPGDDAIATRPDEAPAAAATAATDAATPAATADETGAAFTARAAEPTASPEATET